ncbi:MAG: hypothetical protein KI791_04085 [Cyclobacteriaceae bacterium]|nr:hypothetical protein [Cyclobacteriaceae bacterium SS2]
MTTQLKEKLISEANKLIVEAKNELSRPEEDVVTYTVCEKAYTAVRKLLMHYLEEKTIDLPGEHTFNQLVSLCQKHNPALRKIDFEPMLEFRDKEDIWADMSIANIYVGIAEKTKKLVQ